MTTDPLSTSRDPLIGTKIDGRYHVSGMLGRGGMGVVYEGTQLQLERPVAIKVLGAGIAGDPVAVQRFLREARTASQLTHGNIVDVQDLGVLPDGRPYLVMPKMQGIDLGALLHRDGPQSPRRTVELLIGAAAALDLIHAKGYVHRDVKPENLMYVVREDGSESTMLLDFGIVGLVSAQAARLTAEGSVFGTPAYLAPEAIQGERADRRGDVYSLATVAFELLSGRVPFEADNPLRILPMKIMEDPPRMSEICDIAFPESIEAVIAKGLTREPQERWASAGEFIAALDGAVLALEELAGKVEPRSRSASLRRSVAFGRAVEPVSTQRRAQPATAEQQELLAEAAAQAAEDARQLEAALAPSVIERGADSVEARPLTSGSPTLSTELPALPTTRVRRHWLGLGVGAGVLLGAVAVMARLALHEPERVTAVPASEPATHLVHPQPLAASPAVEPAPEPEPPQAAAAPADVAAEVAPALPTARPRLAKAERGRPSVKPAPAPASKPGIGASELVQAAARELIQGHLSTAADLYTQATRLDPKSEPAFRGLGLVNERLGKKTDAIRAFNRALALAPNGQNAAMLRARLAKLQAAP